MIPKNIELKNFLSYGPEPTIVNFADYNLICLSGKNGHGKSALLDAMTWAIWGQARKTTGTSKADDGLLHLGQKHMLVTFDFQIKNQHFRVRREYVKTKSKPFSALDFGVVSENNEFTTMTDKTIKSTQNKIEATIGVSYESFVNSAFLRQGQSNEFSKKSAKERKEILASILHLEQFDVLKKAASEKHKELQLSMLQKESIIERLTNEATTIKAALQELPEITKQIKTFEQETIKLNKELEQLEERKTEHTKKEKQHELLAQELKNTQIQAQALTEKHKTIEQERLQLESAIKVKHSPEKLTAAIATLKDSVKKHQKKLNKRLELKEDYLKLQEETAQLHTTLKEASDSQEQQYQIDSKLLQEQHNNLTIQHKKLTQEISNTDTHIKKNKHSIEELQKAVQKAQQDITNLEQVKASFQKHNNEYQKLIEKGSLQKQNINELEQKESIAADNQQPSCPLCEQNLSASRKTFLHKKLHQQKELLQQEITNIKDDITKLKTLLSNEYKLIQNEDQFQKTLTTATADLQSKKQENNTLHQQVAKLSAEQQKITVSIATIEQDQKKLVEDKKKRDDKEKSSDTHRKYETNLKKIDALKQTAKKLAYSKEDHEKDLQSLQQHEQDLKNYHNQQQNITLLQQLSKQSTQLQEELAKLSKAAQSTEKKITQLNFKAEYATHISKEITTTKESIQKRAQSATSLLQQKGALDSKTIKEKELTKELADLDTTLQATTKEAQDYHDIIKTLGKDGIQALLIEEAIPEIEDEANILLGQLTNNQTHILIESLRDLKKGGSKETLDIKISDTAGIRPYEMFSGGEAFRIDFALRVAISKLLARRSGTTLQTLIIDEGFGSQDEESLQMIMDCIHKIQNNFAKIIVVSHLPSLKEQFPVHFHIQKKSTGSTITITEQG